MSPTSIPSPATQPPTFSPPKYAIWVNSLWFLSLAISLTGALLATMLQRWARRYIRLTQPAQCSIEKRARVRAFFADGADKMGLPWVVEALPALLHISLFLFFSGLVVFLWNVNHTVSLSVTCCIGLFSVVYVCITFMPVLQHNSPYYTPISQPASYIAIVIRFIITCLIFAVLSPLALCCGYFWAIFSSGTDRRRRSNAVMDHRPGVNTRWNGTIQDLSISVAHTQRRFWLPLNYLLGLFEPIFRDFWHWVSRLWNKETAIEKIIPKQSSTIDLGILTWMVQCRTIKHGKFF